MNFETLSCRTDFAFEGAYKKLRKSKILELANVLGVDISFTKRNGELSARIFRPFLNTNEKIVLSHMDEALSAQMAWYVLDHVRDILMSTSRWEVMLIRDIVEAGPHKSVGRWVDRLPCTLFDILQIKIREIGFDGKRYYAMSDELRMAIGDSAAQLLNDPEFLAQTERLQFCRGLLTLYGVMPLTALYDRLNTEYPDNEELNRRVLASPELVHYFVNIPSRRDNPYVESIFLQNVFDSSSSMLEQIQNNDRIEYPRYFVLTAGLLPYPLFTISERDRFYDILMDRFGVKKSRIDRLMYYVWLNKQNKDFRITNGYDLLSELKINFRFNELGDLLELIGDFGNAVPCWVKNGNPIGERLL